MPQLHLAHAVSGAAGGIISTLATYSLITLSSRSQVKSTHRDESDHDKVSLLSALCQTISSKGFSSLYAGVHSALFGVAVTNFIYFGVLQHVKSAYLLAEIGDRATRTLSVYESTVASAIAGAAAVVVSNPIWVVNTRCMCQMEREEEVEGDAREPKVQLNERETRSKTAWEVVIDIVRRDGIGALWHGLLPALILVINPIIQFAVFEQARGWAEKLLAVCRGESPASDCPSSRGAPNLGPFVIFALSAIAKLIASTMTYPSLVLKTRRQFGSDRKKSIVGRRSRNMQRPVLAILLRIPVVGELVEIVADEGVLGLYKGFTAKILQSMLAAGILFAAKEELLHASLQIVQLMSQYSAILLRDALR